MSYCVHLELLCSFVSDALRVSGLYLNSENVGVIGPGLCIRCKIWQVSWARETEGKEKLESAETSQVMGELKSQTRDNKATQTLTTGTQYYS